jgi:hypothetical protein
VREAFGETGPVVDLKKQFGDLDVGERCRDLLNQVLRRLRHGGVEWRDLQARVGEDSIWEVVRSRKLVHSVQFFLQRGQPDSQVLFVICIDSKRELAWFLQSGELLRRHHVLVEVLELARALNPDIAGSQSILQLRQSAQLAIATINPCIGEDEFGRKRQMTESKIKSAKKLLASGLPPPDVAGNLGVSVPTLYRWIPASTQL